MEKQDVSKLPTKNCANNGGYYCEYLNASDKYCKKFGRRLSFEEPRWPFCLQFFEKCYECGEQLKDKKCTQPE